MSADGGRDTDILIVGAGLPGLALALALRGSGLTVALADRRHPCVEEDPDWDARIFAISPGNAALLHRIGAWPRMDQDRLGPIESMRIFADRGARLDFSAFDQGVRALAWIVEQRELMAGTLAAWADADTPETIHADSPPEALIRERDRAVVRLADGSALTARLVVGADGLRSWTRDQAGIAGVPRPYGHTAIVANFATERPHHGRAWQWFKPDGSILAFLPLAGRRMSIVWSLPEARSKALMEAGEAAFLDELAEAGEGMLGRLDFITPRAAFPLNFMRLSSPVADRVALIGDAAHGIHPLAGQGLNLGYGDVEGLAAALRCGGAVGDPGSLLVLGRYARARAWPTLSMQTVCDGLWRLFNVHHPVPSLLRNAGMAALNRLPPVKSILMQPAMG